MSLLNSILLQAAAPENPWMQFLPFILIIVVFYFFMIRPQMKKQKELRNFREGIKKGDEAMTISGIHGKITDIKDDVIFLEIAPSVRIKVHKSGIIADASSMPPQR
jgi:preprotein translocase subunit YajC